MDEDNQKRMIQAVEGCQRDTERIVRAIEGDKSMGIQGLASRMDELRDMSAKHTSEIQDFKISKGKAIAWISGLATAASFGISRVWESFKGVISNQN